MTDKYILKDEAVNAVKSLISKMPARDNYAKGYDAALGRVLIEVRKVPTSADVQPVKRGAWRKDEQGYDVYVECSECGLNLSTSNYVENEWREILKYCPNCGARMDLGDEKT